MTKPLVSPEWLYNNLSAPDLILLDARLKKNTTNSTPNYNDLQIPSARYFDLRNTFRDLDNKLPNTLPNSAYFEQECRKLGISKNSRIVVYDNLGVYASPRVWWLFKTNRR